MDVYEYVASTNPFIARSIIESFGYRMQSRDIAQNLRDLVNYEGESALKAIMQNHPEKEIILELFSTNNEVKNTSKCGCNNKKEYLNYLQASGTTQQSEATKYGLQTNTFLLASALILAVAIISKN